MRLAGTTTEEVSSTSTRVLKEEEERVIGELFESTRHATTEGISSLDRILKLELEDADRALSDALESSGSVMASLSAYVSEVERSMEDVNAWSTVFETKLVNMRRNIEIIKGRDDKRDVSNENKRALAAAVRGLLGELELPVGVERAVREHSLDDERGILTIYDALRRLLDFKRKLRDGLPAGIATMRVTVEAREQVEVIAMHAFERVFERLRAIAEGWVRWSTQKKAMSDANTWEAIQSDLKKFERLFDALSELSPTTADAFARLYCQSCVEVMRCDIVMIMDAIDKQDTEADAINVAFQALRTAIAAMETVGNTVETFLGTTFRIASNNREFYHQEIITGLEGCLLDLIEQSIATNSALCVAFLAALIDTSASTHALGQYALTESVNNFQVVVEAHINSAAQEFARELSALRSKQSSTRNSGGEYEFRMPELDPLRKIISAHMQLQNVFAANGEHSADACFLSMCDVACTHIEHTASAVSKRHDRVRLQGYFSLARCFERGENEGDVSAGLAAQLDGFMTLASSTYVAEVCEKHFGKLFGEIHALRSGSSVGTFQPAGDRRAHLLKLYKIAIPNVRGVEKSVEACAKTLMKDLIVHELVLRTWRELEAHVVEGLSSLKAALGDNKTSDAIPIAQVQHTFAVQSKSFH